MIKPNHNSLTRAKPLLAFRIFAGRIAFILLLLISFTLQLRAGEGPKSTSKDALRFIDSIKVLNASPFWPNVRPDIFLLNLRGFATEPLMFYEGKSTNFCAYSALTFIPLHNDPLGFSKFLVKLYNTGEAQMGRVMFRPEKAVREEAGLLKYKGSLDLNAAAQMWFLSLADEFKGYLNILNQRFHKGDENTLWAATNFAKFNRMLRQLFPSEVKAWGSDLIRPWIGDTYSFLKKKLETGTVFLYLNNRTLNKKSHEKVKFGIPTHYVLLLDIYKVGDKINILYWDYGLRTLQQVSPKLLKRIVFGITHVRLEA